MKSFPRNILSTPFIDNKFLNNSLFVSSFLDISKEFKALAVDTNNNIEMFEHKKKKLIGVMWHPEREMNYYRLKKIINKLKIKK